MPSLGIYTNCQGEFIHRLFLSRISFFRDWTIVYLKNYKAIADKMIIDKNDLQAFDIFLYQPVSEKHGIYSTLNEDGILSMLRPDCLRISFPSLYTDMWPIYENNGYYYGADIILKYKAMGMSLDTILQLYDNNILSFNLKERFEGSLNYLISRESQCTIQSLSNYISNNMKYRPIFYTQNHPSIEILDFLTQEICKSIQGHLGVSFDTDIKYNDDDIMSIKGYGICEGSRFITSELGLEYTVDDNSEYYKNLIVIIYNCPSLAMTR